MSAGKRIDWSTIRHELDGKTAPEISKETGISMGSIHYAAKKGRLTITPMKKGVRPGESTENRKNGWKKIELSYLKALICAGVRYKVIPYHLNDVNEKLGLRPRTHVAVTEKVSKLKAEMR